MEKKTKCEEVEKSWFWVKYKVVEHDFAYANRKYRKCRKCGEEQVNLSSDDGWVWYPYVEMDIINNEDNEN